MDQDQSLEGPDLTQGVDVQGLGDGETLLGHAGGEKVLLTRCGREYFAVSATCTHYGGPLADGLVVGDTVRCPLHHACFSLRTGRVLARPALEPIATYDVERRLDKLFVLGKAARLAPTPSPSSIASIVIVGGGAAGHSAAEELRNQGYRGKVTMLSADSAPPCDRPNLSKDYLAGQAPEEWIPLRPPEFFAEHAIELVLDARAARIDVPGKAVVLEDGRRYAYDALLLATGAEPVKLTVPGADSSHVHSLRTLADSRSIIDGLGTAKSAVVIGASFIGLEVAASLRERGLAVRVVAPDARPLERVLGPELGDFIRALHEEHGTEFHLGRTAKAIEPNRVVLDDDSVLAADLVVAGIGVRPALSLAKDGGLAIDRGISVNEYLETSAPGIFAAGDVARWPDPHSGEKIRVEHWVVAGRHGQIAAQNLLGKRTPCDIVPFFWSKHHDVYIAYVGHAESWDAIDIEGSLEARDCKMSYRRGGTVLAVATIGRDRASLEAELEIERRRRTAKS